MDLMNIEMSYQELSSFYETNQNEGENEYLFSTSQDDPEYYKKIDFKELLNNILGNEKQQYQIDKQIELSSMIEKNEIFVSIPKIGIQGLYGITIDIISKKDQIALKSYLVKPDFQPYYASNKNQINVLQFHALKQNDKTEQGSYSIDPFTGLYSYKTVLQLSFIQMIKLNQKNIEDYLKDQFKIHERNMRRQAPKLLFLMNKIGFKSMQQWTQELLKLENKFQNIEIEQSNFSQLEKNQDLNKEIESDQKLEQLYKDIKLIVREKMFKDPDEKIDGAAFENIPKPKSLPLLTQINVDTSGKTEVELIRSWKEKSQLINQGGYSEIRKETIYFTNQDNTSLKQKRVFAVKFDKEQDNNKNEKKVVNEIKILNALKGKQNQQAPGSAYIISSYIDENLKNCYFMELYNNGSLEQFISQKNITLSLRTKLFLLAGIISGIDFIHSKDIVHLDIKLGNILIQKQLIPKICDFGEARFLQNLTQEKRDYSRSMPFAAPELYNKEPLTKAFDIYSFGMIFSILIFEQFPFEFNPNDYSNLESRYENKTYCIKRSIQYQMKQGPQKILKQCFKILVACLSPIPNQRPQAKWILSAIWKMIHFLDAF